MERPGNVGDWNDQSNSNENEEIQPGGARNHRNPWDLNWTAKDKFGRNAAEVLDRNKHRHREWVSMGTMEKIQERKNKKTAINNSRRRAEKVKAQAEYAEANKQVKNFKASKQKYVEN
ncbi:unnamed protein product [Schistosoma margrebowiei]|uniref:Uncharacterized protein n=1 Tax=Schistosoma margrebowiei TaxID=48269 RepID=A0A183MCS2_9TREM|nr:unnamed protein product [Schistosoma margrebowiei]